MTKHLAPAPFSLVFSTAFLLGAAAGAQVASRPAEPPEPAARFDEKVGVTWVSVPTVVRNPGGYVRGLKAEDFELSVDGKRIAIETFDTAMNAPVHLVILQDTSGSMGPGGKLAASRELARHVIGQARATDQFALATFAGGRLTVDVPFTFDRDVLEESVAGWEAWGTTALHDAVAWLPTLTADRDGVKRAAVLVTDGLDNASTFEPQEARDLVRQAQLPVYIFGFETGDAYDVDAQGKKVFRNADMLNLLASLSGGRYYPLRDPDDLKEAVLDLVEDLRHQYVLGFSVADDGSKASHAIKVRVRGGIQRTATARAAYRGGNPVAANRAIGRGAKP
jgi:VWFA-related protein